MDGALLWLYDGTRRKEAWIMSIIAVMMISLFGVYVYRNYWGRILAAKRNGTETDATVCRIEQEVRYYHGEKFIYNVCYVRFLRPDGLENEAKLLNPKKKLMPGATIRVRYLPERNDVAVMCT